jgi:geranylgeranyl pyrophosphate synthase
MTEKDETEKIIKKYAEAISSRLRKTLLENQGYITEKLAKDYVTLGGKRLRPSLTLIVCEALSGPMEIALDTAVIFELAHTASLVQDDVIDNSSIRHGVEAAHERFGIGKAIILSDTLIFEIFEQLKKLCETNIRKRQLSSLLSYLARASKDAAEGEMREVFLSEKEEFNDVNYFEVAKLKTGSLFGSSAAAGAIAADAHNEIVERIYEFGCNVGIAFQIVDDVIDFFGKSSDTGKPIFRDIENKATNIILVHALRNSEPLERNRLNYFLKKSNYGLSEVEEIRNILERIGSVEYALAACRRYTKMARDCINFLPNNQARKKLEALTFAIEKRRR